MNSHLCFRSSSVCVWYACFYLLFILLQIWIDIHFDSSLFVEPIRHSIVWRQNSTRFSFVILFGFCELFTSSAFVFPFFPNNTRHNNHIHTYFDGFQSMSFHIFHRNIHCLLQQLCYSFRRANLKREKKLSKLIFGWSFFMKIWIQAQFDFHFFSSAFQHFEWCENENEWCRINSSTSHSRRYLKFSEIINYTYTYTCTHPLMRAIYEM